MRNFSKLAAILAFTATSFFATNAQAEENLDQQAAEMTQQLGINLENASVFQADIISAHGYVETKEVRFASPMRPSNFNPVFAGGSYENDQATFTYRYLPLSLDY